MNALTGAFLLVTMKLYLSARKIQPQLIKKTGSAWLLDRILVTIKYIALSEPSFNSATWHTSVPVMLLFTPRDSTICLRWTPNTFLRPIVTKYGTNVAWCRSRLS